MSVSNQSRKSSFLAIFTVRISVNTDTAFYDTDEETVYHEGKSHLADN